MMARERHDHASAKRQMSAALLLRPKWTWVWDLAGHLFGPCERDHATAVYCFRRSFEVEPGSYATLNLGLSLFETGKYEEAIRQFDQVLHSKPDHENALYHKAASLLRLCRYEQARPVFEAALATGRLADSYKSAAERAVAETALVMRDMETGYRIAAQTWSTRKFSKPQWNGEPLEGKTLLVYQEHGYGDSIQYVRLLPMLRPAKVIYAVWPQLVSLFRDAPGVDEVYSIFDPNFEKLEFDYRLADYLLSNKLNIHPDTNPVPVPYLAADPIQSDLWRKRLAADRNFKVGIVWSGNPEHCYDRFRSSRLSDWRELATLPGVSLYNLQKNDANTQMFQYPDVPLSDVSREVHTFADAAALMSALDLVISIDSAPAHLAGALGRPVWLLLAAQGVDWRWPRQGDSTPWYPNTRLFRQEPGQSWRETLGQVKDELARHLADRGRCRTN
jgi:tetratricopeptide (TPR) repeat protein